MTTTSSWNSLKISVMAKYPFLDMKALTAPYAGELKEACARVVDSGWFLHGPETLEFEKELATFVGRKHCVAVSNGLDALRLILKAWVELGLMAPGDEVIVPANTYVASVLAITDAGLIPVLVEPETSTYNLDPQRIEEAISPRTRAIMEVHLYGTPARHSQISEIAERHGLLIIEDNAQAIGASENGLRTGGMGDAAAFSFYPTKNIGALGDAGAVTTDNEDVAATVRALANYGSDRRYHNIYRGYNCRMDEIQAAMLRVKLRHIEAETRRRQLAALTYDEAITHPDIVKPQIISNMEQVWHQYVIRTSHRDELRKYLDDNGVQTDIHYATPPHMQPCYASLQHGPLPLTEELAGQVVSLPIATANPEQVREIADIINRF